MKQRISEAIEAAMKARDGSPRSRSALACSAESSDTRQPCSTNVSVISSGDRSMR